MASNNDLGLVYNHPSIVSNITNNDTIFSTTTGNRPFFATIVSERGEDNKIKLISSVEEFLFNYGNPNLKLYGQAAYNILNILQNNETVYVLRAMPDNAGYSHAILNIQTKVSNKKLVKDVNGECVELDNVILRPTVIYSKSNNTSTDLLDYELDNSSKITTIDGYKNNLLFYAYPVGRGSYYDKFGFRIYLNTSYDDSYDFRVYNFEVVSYDEYDNVSIIEGPFYVSFDPDAMSASNESMFIEDVVNKYSTYLKISFNENVYDEITSLINPDVNPSHIDILSGQTRTFNNAKENFYCKETKNYEDIHIRIQQYDKNGNAVKNGSDNVTNISDSSDTVESSILAIDNSIRSNEYTTSLLALNSLKEAIAALNAENYTTVISNLGVLDDNDKFQTEDAEAGTADCKIIEQQKQCIESWETFIADKTVFDNDKKETTFTQAYSDSTVLETYINDIMTTFRTLYNYIKIVNNDSAVVSVEENILKIQSLLNTKEILSIKLLSFKSILNTYLSNLSIIKTYQDIDTEVDDVKLILVEVNNILDYFDTIIDRDTDLYTSYNSISTLYNNTLDEINNIEDEFYPSSSKPTSMKNVYTNVEDIIAKSILMCNEILLVNEYKFGIDLFDISGDNLIQNIITGLEAQLKKALSDYETKISNPTTKAEMISLAKDVITTQKINTDSRKSTTFIANLQDFNSPIRFNNGSEGDLDTSDTVLRNKTIENLLIKGYKGTIDYDITNKRKILARFILDANYSDNVKAAINTLVTEIRDDIIFFCDLGFTASPEGAIAYRDTNANFSSTKVAIYAQDFTIYDEYTGRDIKVTTPYFLAKKIPANSSLYGLHMPIAGNKRGTIDGFKNISWTPNEAYKEIMYNKKINYIESDTKRTKFGCQLTSEARTTPLSNINNVITVIDIKKDAEEMGEDYQFEFNNQETIDSFQQELNDKLAQYVSSKAVERASATVYSSDYDKQQKILRVSIEVKFYDIIERILISIDVVKQ